MSWVFDDGGDLMAALEKKARAELVEEVAKIDLSYDQETVDQFALKVANSLMADLDFDFFCRQPREDDLVGKFTCLDWAKDLKFDWDKPPQVSLFDTIESGLDGVEDPRKWRDDMATRLEAIARRLREIEFEE